MIGLDFPARSRGDQEELGAKNILSACAEKHPVAHLFIYRDSDIEKLFGVIGNISERSLADGMNEIAEGMKQML